MDWRSLHWHGLDMATSLKQHKAIGEDLWKGRTDKIVRRSSSSSSSTMVHTHRSRSECRAVRVHIWRARRAAHPGLRGLRRGQQAARQDGVQHRNTSHRGLSRSLQSRSMPGLSRGRRGRQQGIQSSPSLSPHSSTTRRLASRPSSTSRPSSRIPHRRRSSHRPGRYRWSQRPQVHLVRLLLVFLYLILGAHASPQALNRGSP